MKLKSIKNFLDCKEGIIRIEINRSMLNQSKEGIAEVISDRLWLESEFMLNKEINKLADMITDDKSDYDVLRQISELIADEAAIKDIIGFDGFILADEVVTYIKQDIEEKLPIE